VGHGRRGGEVGERRFSPIPGVIPVCVHISTKYIVDFTCFSVKEFESREGSRRNREDRENVHNASAV
jgi:hypothetical protein